MIVGSLFAGIGGLDLGLERAGMRTVWQVESDAYCQRVLARHWPGLPRWGDVRTFPPPYRPDDRFPRPDLICGGFPCQDVSLAGRRKGIHGDRSGLWFEMLRVVREVGPRYVLVENVPGLLVRGMDRVLGDLAESGYDADWDCIPAATVGAPHLRYRVFVVAHRNGGGCIGARAGCRAQDSGADGRDDACGCGPPLADADIEHDDARRHGAGAFLGDGCSAADVCGGESVSDADRLRRDTGDGAQESGRQEAWRWEQAGPPASGVTPDAQRTGLEIGQDRERLRQFAATTGARQWAVEPDVGRVAHGVPARVDRIRALGNAVVPQVAQFIGERIMAIEDRRRAFARARQDAMDILCRAERGRSEAAECEAARWD